MWEIYLEKETAESNSKNPPINTAFTVDLEPADAINYSTLRND
jgi:hypothetical protein